MWSWALPVESCIECQSWRSQTQARPSTLQLITEDDNISIHACHSSKGAVHGHHFHSLTGEMHGVTAKPVDLVNVHHTMRVGMPRGIQTSEILPRDDMQICPFETRGPWPRPGSSPGAYGLPGGGCSGLTLTHGKGAWRVRDYQMLHENS
jgi:hypothetical protein